MAKHPFLALVALGPIDPDILRRLRAGLAKFLHLPVRVLRPKPLPLQTLHLVRQQYHSTQLLEFLLDDQETRASRILGVTAGDLYIPILTFVFGEAQLNGKAAIISLFRPRGDADRTQPPHGLILSRLLKLSLHELGHTFGLEHCRAADCLMKFSANLEKLDLLKPAFCGYCRIMLQDSLRDQGLLPHLRRYAETRAPGAATPAADSSHIHRPPASRRKAE